MGILGDILKAVAFRKSERRADDRADREARGDERDLVRLQAERRHPAEESPVKLRDNLKYHIEREESVTARQVLERRLVATEEALTNLCQDTALSDPRFS